MNTTVAIGIFKRWEILKICCWTKLCTTKSRSEHNCVSSEGEHQQLVKSSCQNLHLHMTRRQRKSRTKRNALPQSAGLNKRRQSAFLRDIPPPRSPPRGTLTRSPSRSHDANERTNPPTAAAPAAPQGGGPAPARGGAPPARPPPQPIPGLPARRPLEKRGRRGGSGEGRVRPRPARSAPLHWGAAGCRGWGFPLSREEQPPSDRLLPQRAWDGHVKTASASWERAPRLEYERNPVPPTTRGK